MDGGQKLTVGHLLPNLDIIVSDFDQFRKEGRVLLWGRFLGFPVVRNIGKSVLPYVSIASDFVAAPFGFVGVRKKGDNFVIFGVIPKNYGCSGLHGLKNLQGG